MAKLAQSTTIGSGGLNGSYANAATQQLAIYNYRLNDADRSSRYLHFKTNVLRGQNQMVMIEAVGYAYTQAQPIRCSWSWYSYSATNNSTTGTLQNIGLHNVYTGMVPNAVYHSSDNFVCFSASARDLYFVGVTLNAYTMNPNGPGLIIQITNSGSTTSAGNFF